MGGGPRRRRVHGRSAGAVRWRTAVRSVRPWGRYANPWPASAWGCRIDGSPNTASTIRCRMRRWYWWRVREDAIRWRWRPWHGPYAPRWAYAAARSSSITVCNRVRSVWRGRRRSVANGWDLPRWCCARCRCGKVAPVWRPRRVTPATGRWRLRHENTMRRRCCWPTPVTTRPRRCCWGCCAPAASMRSPACRPRSTATGCCSRGRSWNWGVPTRRRSASSCA